MLDVLFGAALSAALEAWAPTALGIERHRHLLALSALLSANIVIFGAVTYPVLVPPRWTERTPGLGAALDRAPSVEAEPDACWRLLGEAGGILPYDDRMDVFEHIVRVHRARGLRPDPKLPTLASTLRIPRRDYESCIARAFPRGHKC